MAGQTQSPYIPNPATGGIDLAKTPTMAPVAQAYKTVTSSGVQNINNILDQYHSHYADPQVAYTLAQQTHLPSDTLSKALQWANILKKQEQASQYQINMSKQGQSGWGEFAKTFSDIWGHFVHGMGPKTTYTAEELQKMGVDPYANNVQIPNQFQQGIKRAEDSVKGAYNVGKATFVDAPSIAINRALSVIPEMLGIGHMHIPGVIDYTAPKNRSSYTDAMVTLHNAFFGLNNLLNPINVSGAVQDAQGKAKNPLSFLGNLFNANSLMFMPVQAMSAFENLRNKYGTDYAIGGILPLLVASRLGAGGIVESEIGASVLDQQIVSDAARLTEQGIKLTNEQTKRVELAQKRIDSGYNQADVTIEGQGETSKVREAAANYSEFVTSPLSFAAKLAKQMGSPLSSTSANLTYLLTYIGMNQMDPELWKQSAGGTVIDSNGRTISLGQDIANQLGLTSSDLFYSPVSGMTDFITKFIISDPMGTAGKFIGKGLSYNGFTGNLGAWYGGLGIRGIDDVYRTARQYLSVRRAYEYMANHTAAEIYRTFKGTYSREMAQRLGDARSYDEVLLIHAEMGDAMGLLTQKAPTLSMYSSLKASLRDSAGNYLMDKAGLLDADYEFLKHMQAIHDGQSDIKMNFDSAAYAGIQKWDIRFRSMWRHWINDIFGANPMWYSELTGKLETMKINPGDTASITAIMDMATAAHLPKQVVKGMGDFLLHTTSAEDFVTAYRQCLHHMVMRRAVAGLDRTQFDLLAKEVENMTWDLVVRRSGADGGGRKSSWVEGPDGPQLGRTEDEAGNPTGASGISLAHLGTLRLPRAQDMIRLGNEMRKIVASASKEDIMNLRDALSDAKQIEQLGVYSQVTTQGILEKLSQVSNMRLLHADPRFPHFGKDGLTGYQESLKEIRKITKTLERTKSLKNEEKFVQIYEQARQKLNTAIIAIKSHEHNAILDGQVGFPVGEIPAAEALDMFGPKLTHPSIELSGGSGEVPVDIFQKMSAAIDPKVIDHLRGEAFAWHDLILTLNSVLKGTTTTDYKYLKSYADNAAKARTKLAEEQKKLSDALVEKLNDRVNNKFAFFAKRGLRNRYQYVVDGMNQALSYLFVPLALLSTGWAVRVGMSEAMLSVARQGGFNFFEAKIMNSIAKHELKGRELMKIGDRDERTLVRDLVAGALLGLERNLVKGMDVAERDRMLSNFVNYRLRHEGGSFPGAVEHGNNDMIDQESAHHAMKKLAHAFDENMNVTERKARTTGEFVHTNIEDPGYLTGLGITLNERHKDILRLPIHQAIDEELRLAGMNAFNADRESFIKQAVQATEDFLKSEKGQPTWEKINASMEETVDNLRSNEFFKTLTEQRQKVVLDAIESLRPTPESITYDALKPYMQKAYAASQRQLERTQTQIERLETSLANDQRYIENYSSQAISQVDTAGSQVAEKLATVKSRIAENEKLLEAAKKAEKEHPFVAKTTSGRFSKEFKAEKQAMSDAKDELAAAREQLIKNVEREVEANHAEIDRRFGGTVHVPDGRVWDVSRGRYTTVDEGNPYQPLVSGNDFLLKGPDGRRYFSRRATTRDGSIIARGWDTSGEMSMVVGGEDAGNLAEKHYGLVKRQEALQNFLRDLKANKITTTELEHLNIGGMGDAVNAARDSQFSMINGIPIEHILRGEKSKAEQLAEYVEYKRGQNIGSQVLRGGAGDLNVGLQPFKNQEEFTNMYQYMTDASINGEGRIREQADEWLNYFDPQMKWVDEEKWAQSLSGTDPKTEHFVNVINNNAKRFYDSGGTVTTELNSPINIAEERMRFRQLMKTVENGTVEYLRYNSISKALLEMGETGKSGLLAFNAKGELVSAMSYKEELIGNKGQIKIGVLGAVEGSQGASHAIQLELSKKASELPGELDQGMIFSELASDENRAYHESIGRNIQLDPVYAIDKSWWTKEQVQAIASGNAGLEKINYYRPASEIFQQESKLEEAFLKENEDRNSYYKVLNDKADANAALSESRRELAVLSRQIEKMPTRSGANALIDSRVESMRDAMERKYLDLKAAHEKLNELVRQQQEIKENAARIQNKRIDQVTRSTVKDEARSVAKLDKESARLYKKAKNSIGKRTQVFRDVFDQSLNGLVTQAGENAFSKEDDINNLLDRLTQVGKSQIRKLDPDTRARIRRNDQYIENKKYAARLPRDPEDHWAFLNAYSSLFSVTGVSPYEDAAGKYRIHSHLNSQVVSGNVEHAKTLGAYLKNAGKDYAPQNILAEGYELRDLLHSAAGADLILKVSDAVHTNVLGRIVNGITRTSESHLEYHKAMEGLRPLIERGIIDDFEAELLADKKAMFAMSKYFHNPKDKTVFEHNMRVLAPFYFAKNQAWRRAFRVLGDDPGAFEKYMKMALALTDYVSYSSQNSSVPNVHLPGSEVAGNVVGSNALSLVGMGGGFGGLAFGLSMSPGSIDSVTPFGSQKGGEMLLNIFRPAWGPWVTTTLRYARDKFFDTSPLATKYINDVLGPIAKNGNFGSDVFPSGVGRSAVETVLAALNIKDAAALTSTQDYIINNNFDNLLHEEYVKVSKSQDVINQVKNLTAAQKEWYIYNISKANVEAKFINSAFKQEFIDTAHAEAVNMYIIKTAVGLGAPFAISVQQEFSKSPEFDKIFNSINPDTGEKYTLSQTYTQFAKLYPFNQFDMVSHSSYFFMKYPSTVAVAKLLTDHPDLVREFPYAAGFIAVGDQTQSTEASTLETSMHLRSKAAPKDYLNSLLVAAGDAYYYQYLVPSLMYADPTDPSKGLNGLYAKYDVNGQPTLNYKGYSEAQKQILNYGNKINPTWLADFSGGARNNTAFQSYNQMVELLKKPNLPISKLEKQRWDALMSYYNTTVTQINNFYQYGDSTDAKRVTDDWKAWCDSNATNPLWTNQSSFITSVARRLPTVTR